VVVHSVVAWDVKPECIIDEIRVSEISLHLMGLPHRTMNRESAKVLFMIGATEALMNELKRVIDW